MTLLGMTLDVVHGWVLALLPLAALPLLAAPGIGGYRSHGSDW